MTNEQRLAAIFEKVSAQHRQLTKKQQEFAVKEIGRVRGELAGILAEYADDTGTIKRTRINALIRELDGVEKTIREYGTSTLNEIITESSEWTTAKIDGSLKDIVGSSAISTAVFNEVNRDVLDYVTKRFGTDKLVLSDRVWSVSADIREQISAVIRSGVIRGVGINTMIAQVRKAYDNETWKIKRLVVTESNAAYRAATALNAERSDVVEYVKLHAGVKRSRACVSLANADPYNKGRGVYLPSDSKIYSPHPNCTSYITYVLNERYL